MRLLSVNVGRPGPSPWKGLGMTGIDKQAVAGAVAVTAPGPKGTGAVGLAGDRVYDVRHHGGADQAVYAYSREDLDRWEPELGRPLPNGFFGENLTTAGIDVNSTLVGERWRVVDAVAGHSNNGALRFQLLDDIDFVLRHYLRSEIIDAQFAGDGLGGLAVVPGAHNHFEPKVVQSLDRFWSRFLDRVGDGKEARAEEVGGTLAGAFSVETGGSGPCRVLIVLKAMMPATATT